MLLAVLADTHLPRGRRELPAACIARLREADLILHAGDFFERSVLRSLERCGAVAAVHGNVDTPELRTWLPETRVVEADGVRIAMVHDAGPARGRLARMRRRFPAAAAVVFGHSHIPLHEADDDGFQIFNPGSPTVRRRAPVHTMGIGRVTAGAISFELVTLD
ncbi:MAG: metallophosphatase family protein [Actinomycetota bacterium]|nr:metallophosphatase family protein [Actinomycetota bacterium]